MRKLGTEQRAFLEQATTEYQAQLGWASASSTSCLAHLTGRGLAAYATRYRLGAVAEPLPGHEGMRGRLAIPYITPAGVVHMKFRCVEDHDCKAAGCAKYLGAAGAGNRLYNARAVLAARDLVVICEGEFDAMSVSGPCGVPAVGYPGVKAWLDAKSAHWPRVFTGLDVVVVADGDKPGVEGAKAVAKSIEGSKVVQMPPGSDANSVIATEGPEAFKGRLGL